MSKKTKTFTANQIYRLPDEGYWLEYYKNYKNPTGVCVMNGEVKYIHWEGSLLWSTLLWSCCFTKKQIANPGEHVLKYEHFKTHKDMIDAHPELDNAFQSKASNDF